MSCDIAEHYDPIDTERLAYLDLSFDKLKLLPSNLDEKITCVFHMILLQMEHCHLD